VLIPSLSQERGAVGGTGGGGVEEATTADRRQGELRGAFGLVEGHLEQRDDFHAERTAVGLGPALETGVQIAGYVVHIQGRHSRHLQKLATCVR